MEDWNIEILDIWIFTLQLELIFNYQETFQEIMNKVRNGLYSNFWKYKKKKLIGKPTS